MVERKVIHKGNIGNALHSVAPDHITTTADEIFDENRQEYQEDVNECVGVYTDNSEFLKVYTGPDNKFLWGIRRDGHIIYGAGIPSQIKDYIDSAIKKIIGDGDIIDSIYTLKEITTFLEGFTSGSNLKQYLDETYGEYTENDDYINVKTDNNGNLLESTNSFCKKTIHGDFEVIGKTTIQGIEYSIISNPEYIAAWIDSSNLILFGFKRDGRVYVADADFIDAVKANTYDIIFIKETIKINSIDWESLTFTTTTDNYEYLSVETDNNDKFLAGRKIDGTKVEKVGIETPKINVEGVEIDTKNDEENRSNLIIDKEDKIISCRKEDGVLVENVGIETNKLDSKKATIETLIVDDITVAKRQSHTKETFIYLERPKFAEFYFYGNLPTDQSQTRTPTTLDLLYKINGQTLLSSRCTLAIQGHGSAHYPKKGYTFEPINANGEAIDIKWGDMIAVDSFHLKAYYIDKTHSHGIGGPRLWRHMISYLPYPYNKVNNKALNLNKGQKIDAYSISDAKYSEDGFPFAFYLNDKFYGLYTLKLKKNRKNYGMEKSNKNEIFLDSLGFDEAHGHSAKLDNPFDYGAWEVKNPKIKNYEAGGPITDATVLANIERLFTFTNNLATMYNQHADYIVLQHWLTWFIHCELTGDSDKNGNNLELLTWDATHWSILPYDMDSTAGVYADNIYPTMTGLILNPAFYQTFRTVFETEIKQLYTDLRNRGCIDLNTIYKIYLGQVEAIPREIYDADRELWPNGPFTDPDIWPVIEQLYSFFNSRIEYLDSIWLLGN